jgi:hypothetical protein
MMFTPTWCAATRHHTSPYVSTRQHTLAHVRTRQHTSAGFGASDVYVHLVHRNTLTNTRSENDNGAKNREKKIAGKIAKLQQQKTKSCARKDRQAPRVKLAI